MASDSEGFSDFRERNMTPNQVSFSPIVPDLMTIQNGAAQPKARRRGRPPRNPNNVGGAAVVAGNGSTAAPHMRHSPALVLEWSAEEQATLQDGIKEYGHLPLPIFYSIVGMKIPNKTIRDLAFRCQWMSSSLSCKFTEPAAKRLQPSAPSHSPHIDANTSSNAIGWLFDRNTYIFNKISASDHSNNQLNTALLCIVRENIHQILTRMRDVPQTMMKMPPLEARVNEEIADCVLPRMKSLPSVYTATNGGAGEGPYVRQYGAVQPWLRPNNQTE